MPSTLAPASLSDWRVERINDYGYKVWLTADGGFSSDEHAAVRFPTGRDAERAAIGARKPCYASDHNIYV